MQFLPDQSRVMIVAVKLRDLAFNDAQTWVIPKLQIKNKVYQEAKCLIEWDTLTLNGLSYTVVRITLTDRQRKPIHKQPMLLITNIPVYTAGHARAIYGIYLMRAKIEAVFKFLKDGLGWEDFQVRDYESVKNIIALTWFIGGYFYEIGSDLAENPAIVLIAQLGGGKGKVSRYYFLQGIKELLTHAGVVRFIKEQKISTETLEQMLAFVT
jgi:tRNA A37 threonylcarbamoyladenosine biosynthesis protein TsaE